MKEISDQEFVEMIVKAIVENPDDVKTERTVDDKGVLISLILNPSDMGKIIGKGGRTVNSIRKLLHVFGAKSNERVNLKIFEPDGGEVQVSEDTDSAAPAEEMSEEEPKSSKKDEHLKDVPEEVLV